jgi:CheY-like chemotaxis protein
LDILVVEDEHDVRVVLREILEGAGWRVTTAANGRDALAILRAGAKPALVVVDLWMPMMDGWQLMDALRADPELATIPIGVQTAHDDAELPPGLAFVLIKPVDALELLAKVAPFFVRTQSG